MGKIIVIGFCLLFFACKSTKETTNLPDKEDISKKVNEDNYRLVISFFSPGNGIDHKMKQEYTKFIENYRKKITYEDIPWGKEGEIDFCFPLKELSGKEQEEFVKTSKEVLSKSTRVHVYENTPCRHKGWGK